MLLGVGSLFDNVTHAHLDTYGSAEARMQCSTRLAFIVARDNTRHLAINDSHPVEPIPVPFKAEEEIRDVIRWINKIDSNADLYLLNSLINLAEKASAVVDAHATKYVEIKRKFMLAKALCIVTACRLAR